MTTKELDAVMVPRSAADWIVGDDTGLSSEAIWAHMVGAKFRHAFMSYPHDPSDFGRCLRLLDAVPEWKARIGEMAQHGPEWAGLVARWDNLAVSLADEAPTGRAPRTYAAMKDAMAAGGES